jgi:hypothetical protein
MSPLENPGHVERLAKRLAIAARDLGYLSERLRRAGWEDFALEDLNLARSELRQAIDLLTRHARRWRRYPMGDEQ